MWILMALVAYVGLLALLWFMSYLTPIRGCFACGTDPLARSP